MIHAIPQVDFFIYFCFQPALNVEAFIGYLRKAESHSYSNLLQLNQDLELIQYKDHSEFYSKKVLKLRKSQGGCVPPNLRFYDPFFMQRFPLVGK